MKTYILYQAPVTAEATFNPFMYKMAPNHWQEDVQTEFEKGTYKEVAHITASDLGHVFEIGNNPGHGVVNILEKMRSVSVGDIIENHEGRRFIVASFGFDEIEEN